MKILIFLCMFINRNALPNINKCTYSNYFTNITILLQFQYSSINISSNINNHVCLITHFIPISYLYYCVNIKKLTYVPHMHTFNINQKVVCLPYVRSIRIKYRVVTSMLFILSINTLKFFKQFLYQCYTQTCLILRYDALDSQWPISMYKMVNIITRLQSNQYQCFIDPQRFNYLSQCFTNIKKLASLYYNEI